MFNIERMFQLIYQLLASYLLQRKYTKQLFIRSCCIV